MFSSDRNIETLSQLLIECKKYISLRSERMQIDMVSKLSRLLSAFVLGGILFMLVGLAILFGSMMLASALASVLGSEARGYAIILALYALAALLIYNKRKTWIEAPLVALIASIFLQDSESANDETDDGNTPETARQGVKP